MDVLFGGWVASEEYKNWDRRMSKRVIRRSAESNIDLLQPVRSLAATLKQAFASSFENRRACELSPAECFGAA